MLGFPYPRVWCRCHTCVTEYNQDANSSNRKWSRDWTSLTFPELSKLYLLFYPIRARIMHYYKIYEFCYIDNGKWSMLFVTIPSCGMMSVCRLSLPYIHEIYKMYHRITETLFLECMTWWQSYILANPARFKDIFCWQILR